ncbi:hypothetical protein JCM18694_09240 [Prolixibacter denitrificans]|uniref:Uncharacterized protein n=2 Tax=Prolixibacter denitrificans TaxID=1541063 RepID=A0ABQ0ZHC2_9BACT|nr:hypothetical protein JCM18694_09240 [Prolixibacter denitrificans]
MTEMSEGNPPYKRVFHCDHCGYEAQVAGERYLDKGCNNYMETFVCPDCQILYESIVTEITLHKTLPLFFEMKEVFPDFNLDLPKEIEGDQSIEPALYADHDERPESKCLRCGNTQGIKWTKENPICPKCSQLMRTKKIE